jgi:hypothetical protein
MNSEPKAIGEKTEAMPIQPPVEPPKNEAPPSISAPASNGEIKTDTAVEPSKTESAAIVAPPIAAPEISAGVDDSKDIPSHQPAAPAKPMVEDKLVPINGTSKEVEMTDAPKATEDEPETGDKRKADGIVAANGEIAEAAGEEPSAKKPKVAEESVAKDQEAVPEEKVVDKPAQKSMGKLAEKIKKPVEKLIEKVTGKSAATNGYSADGPISRKGSKGKREKKPLPPVGRTERRTRSQGLAG